MDTKKLYWGENNFHEFWESEDHEWLILRNHPENAWTAHRFHHFALASSSAREAARLLNVTLCRDKVWKRDGKGNYALVERKPL